MSTDKSSDPSGKVSSQSGVEIERIGRYDVIYPLGRGGMASVFVGRMPGLAGFEKLVAVKIIHPHLITERRFVDMFLDEARLAAQVHHANVAAVQEIDDDNGVLYMIGELVVGQSLKGLLKKLAAARKRLPQPLAAYIAASAGAGLDAAHNLADADGRPLNLVHRDVSPHNILISYSGNVKLIDFGVASARGRLTHTEAGKIKGKMGYISPEQLTGKKLDQRSDIFSLGVVLYEMVTGRKPFPGKTDMEQLSRLSEGRLVEPRQLVPKIHAEMEQIILTALSAQREDRFPSAGSMAEALNAYIRAQGQPAGSRQLSHVMQRVFTEEEEDHRAQIREYRTRLEEEGEIAENKPSGVFARLRSISRPPPAEIQELPEEDAELIENPRFGRALMFGLGGGLAAAVLAVLAWVYSSQYQPKAKNPDSSSPTSETVSAVDSAGESETVEDTSTDSEAELDNLDKDGQIASPTAVILDGGVVEKDSSVGNENSSPIDAVSAKSTDENDTENPDSATDEIKLKFSIKPQKHTAYWNDEMHGRLEEMVIPADGKKHKLTLEAQGYRTMVVYVRADKDQEISLKLAPSTKKTGSFGKSSKENSRSLKTSPY